MESLIKSLLNSMAYLWIFFFCPDDNSFHPEALPSFAQFV